MEINQNIAEYYDELYPVTEEQKVFYQKKMILFKKPVKFLQIGCGSGKKTEQAHFFPLTLRYLYIRQAA